MKMTEKDGSLKAEKDEGKKNKHFVRILDVCAPVVQGLDSSLLQNIIILTSSKCFYNACKDNQCRLN